MQAAVSWADQIQKLYKVRIFKKESGHLLFGGLGQEKGPIGCVDDLFIEYDPVDISGNSLSFKCGETGAFKDWLFVFQKNSSELYVCPTDNFNNQTCVKCVECEAKKATLHQLNVE